MSAAPVSPETRRANRRLLARLLVVTVAMFGFGYALVPLYQWVCDVTGFNGTTGVVEAADVAAPTSERWVTVQFITTVNGHLPWQFEPRVREMRVRVGELSEAMFLAHSRVERPTSGQAVPSVAPLQAARYFSKTECFCFTRQDLAPGESRDMAVRFVVDERLPRGIGTLTLSYTLFEVDRAEG